MGYFSKKYMKNVTFANLDISNQISFILYIYSNALYVTA